MKGAPDKSGRATAVEPVPVSPLRDGIPSAWEPGKCRVPMWMNGCPAGLCDAPAFGVQLPVEILEYERGYSSPYNRVPYCHGHCCPEHGGPREDEIRVFSDGYTNEGRPMWCAVFPDFENLQESLAAFDGNPLAAREKLKAQAIEARRSTK